MIDKIEKVRGLYWPKFIKPTSYDYAFKHVEGADYAIKLAKPGGVAVQAGGNIGLWPLRMVQSRKFTAVYTFEPQEVLHACLIRNTERIEEINTYKLALADASFLCGIEKRSLASHRVVVGNDVTAMPLDAMNFQNVTLLQLDIEGYEYKALCGGARTIRRDKPVIQIEIDGLGIKNNFGDSDEKTRAMLAEWGYKEDKRIGHDSVFLPC